MVKKPSQQPQRPRRGRGRGRQPGGYGLGPEGDCVCPNCGKRFPHRRGIPCYAETCPECGQKMTRA